MDSFKLYLRQPRMVPCPDCGRMVSRKARACPGCGGPVHLGVVGTTGVVLKWGLLAAMLTPGLVGLVYALGLATGWLP